MGGDTPVSDKQPLCIVLPNGMDHWGRGETREYFIGLRSRGCNEADSPDRGIQQSALLYATQHQAETEADAATAGGQTLEVIRSIAWIL